MMRLRDRLDAHVRRLASEKQIDLTIKRFASPRAYRSTRRIVIRPITGRVSYYTAIHEIAHICMKNPSRRLEQEVAAWRWALNHAIVEPNLSVWNKIANSLDSYVKRAHRRKNMRLPHPDHDFWSLLREAKSQSLQ